jgi:lipopolysaccharide/colanic/teichoic acid biosynthesis glycosyltransferase
MEQQTDTFIPSGMNAFQRTVKRVGDCLIAFVALIVFSPLFLYCYLAVKREDGGPAIFKQERIGRFGKPFYIYKFRSMYMDAEERKKELMAQNEMQGLMFKMDNDPRIIGSEKGPGKGIGNFIRKTSIDELPQFWNILKGDMSLIGTRPPTVNEYEQYDLHHKIRLSMKPGLTGMWQVSGRSDITDFEEVVRLDTEYIEHWSIGLDLKILFKTIKVVFEGEGSK